jgi:LmbE family N-acetylglucosaminyl deacetylase
MTAETQTGTDTHLNRLFGGTLLILAPHMDDEILACGGLLARLPQKERIHIVFATDGMKSPAPVLPWRDAITPDLGALRRDESRAAAALLGVPAGNLEFLCLPEADLTRNRLELDRLVRRSIAAISPDHILVPFRYDRHLDHLAVNHAVFEARAAGLTQAEITEYFVYYRWRLLRRRDVRRYVRPELLIAVDLDSAAGRKRAALDCFTTQTTCFYPWQTRPILRPELLDEECAGPELFLRAPWSMRGTQVFTGSAAWIRVAHRLEPHLVRWKYLLKTALTRSLGRHAG